MDFLHSFNKLLSELCKLPGIGEKSAQRLAFHILKKSPGEAKSLSDAILEFRESMKLCSRCFALSDEGICRICSDARRNKKLFCVVEEPSNLFIIERSGIYNGLYHVLHGALSPLNGVGPEDLKMLELFERLKNENPDELILATNPTIEGEATAAYIAKKLSGSGVAVSRMARGAPMGSDIEYLDNLTLRMALQSRTRY